MIYAVLTKAGRANTHGFGFSIYKLFKILIRLQFFFYRQTIIIAWIIVINVEDDRLNDPSRCY